MTKQRHIKYTLLASGLALLLCVSSLIGSTFAWFTDSVSTGVNTIQSGTLDIALEYSVDGGITWADAEGEQLAFQAFDGRTDILWEPGCTYALPLLRVRNNGNLALKYQIVVSGVDGDAKLLEAIEWTAKVGDGAETDLGRFEGTLIATDDVSENILIKGHMKNTAGNEYQGLTAEGISIAVYATQVTAEFDSIDDQYDKMATIDNVDELRAALAEQDAAFELGADIVLTEGIVIAANQNVTIDLAGYTLSQTKECAGTSYSMISIEGGSLTVKDTVGTGKISFTDTSADDMSSGWASYTIHNNGGVLVVDGGIVEHVGIRTANADNAIFQYAGSTTVNGGVIVAEHSRSLRQWQGDVTINGGSFLGQVWVHAQGDCDFTVTGGSFRPGAKGNDSSSIYVTQNGKNVNVAVSGGTLATKLGMSTAVKCVTGGTFGVAPTAYLAAGYKAIETDGVYVVKRVLTDAERGAFMGLLQMADDGAVITLEAADYGKIILGGGYNRTDLPKNITIIGNPSATIDFAIGHGFTADGWVFKDVVFTGDGFRLQNAAKATNLTLQNCTFIGGATFYSLSSGGGYVDGAEFYKCFFYDTVLAPGSANKNAISIQAAKNISVEGCTFSNVRNAVNFGATAEGTMVIADNIVESTTDRVFRITDAGAAYILTGNTIHSAGDSDGQLMLAKNISDIQAVTLSGNTWNGKADQDMSVTLDGTDYIIR